MSKRKQPSDMNLYRAQLSCKIAMDKLNQSNDVHFAIYNMASAIGDIAKYLETKEETKGKAK